MATEAPQEDWMKLTPDSPFQPMDPDRIIMETDNCLAFLDKHPVSEGHTLVIPKIQAASIYTLDKQIQTELWDTARHVREVLAERFKPDGFNIGINDGAPAGQTVPHAHIHVIPRYKGDVPDPRGGIRWVIPGKARYWKH